MLQKKCYTRYGKVNEQLFKPIFLTPYVAYCEMWETFIIISSTTEITIYISMRKAKIHHQVKT